MYHHQSIRTLGITTSSTPAAARRITRAITGLTGSGDKGGASLGFNLYTFSHGFGLSSDKGCARANSVTCNTWLDLIYKLQPPSGIVIRTILITGDRAAGKSSSCLFVLKKARETGMDTGGIISIRVMEEERTIGYDGLDCSNDDRFPLSRKKEKTQGGDWFCVGDMTFAFSRAGFSKANCILARSAFRQPDILFLDEIGKLEMRMMGFHEGMVSICDSRPPGLALLSCRVEATPWIRDQWSNCFRISGEWIPGNESELWRTVLSSIEE